MADLTARAIAELKAARTDEQRLRAARRLRDFVRVQSRTAGNQNLGSSSGASLSSDRVHQRLFELLSSNDNNDKLSGIFALYELIDEPSPDNETKTIRFANYLSVLLSNATDVRVLALGAKVLGHLARSGAMLTIESLLDDKIKDALKWLQPNGERIEHRRLAAVFVLRELADAAAVTGQHGPVHQRATDIFQSLWIGLTDSRREIREASAKALASCLAIIATKTKSRVNAAVYSNLYSSARDALMAGAAGAAAGTSSSTGGISGVFGFGSGSSALSAKTADAVHGALLTVGELLASPAAATFMNNRPLPAVPPSAQAGGILGTAAALTPPQRFNETCEMVLKHKDSKNQLVRRTVLLLLPKLAHCSPHTFVTRGYAEVSLKHLLSCLPDSKAASSASVAANASMSKEQTSERAIAYLAIGRIALAIGVSLCGNALRPQLERIVTQLRHGLNAAAALATEASRQARAATTAAARASAVRVARNTGAVEALACVAMLSRAVGAGLTEYAHELVDPMFRASMSGTLIGGTSTSGSGKDSVEMYARGASTGGMHTGGSSAEGHGSTGFGTADALSMALTEALSAIGDAIPALRPLLQERLLHELSLLLAGRPFVPPYAEPFADGAHAGHGSTSNGPFGYTVIDADQSRSESSWQAAQGSMGQYEGGTRGPSTAYGLLPPSISGLAGRATCLAIAQGILATGMGSAGASTGPGSSAGASGPGTAGGGVSNGAIPGDYNSSNSNTRAAGFTGLGSPYGLSSGISPGGVPFSHGWARSLAASAAGYGPSDAHGPSSGYTAGSTGLHSQHGGQGTGGLGSAGMQGAMGANIPAYGPHTGGQGFGPGSSGTDAAWMSWSTGKPSRGALHGLYGPVVLARARGVPSETVCLALHTLGSFDFSGVPLLPFVREVVLLYIEDPDPTLRLEAALTCAKLTVRPSELAGELESADAEPLLAAALFDAEAELAADVAASGEGEEVDELSRARQIAGLDTIDDDEDAVIGVDVLGPVALLRATATHRARNSHTLAAHPPGSSGSAAGGAGVATLWGDARSVPDVNPVAATLSSSYDTRRRHRAFRSRYMRITRPPTHPLLVWGIDAVSMGGQAGSGLIYGRPRASASASGYGSFYAKSSVNAYGVPSPRAAWLPVGFDSGAGGDLSGSGPGQAPGTGGSGGQAYASHPAMAHPAALKEGYIYNRFRGSSTVDSGNLLGALTAVVGPGPTLALISQILQRLLVVSIADSDPVIRYEVLNALDGRFDTLLVEESSLKLLIQGLSDENYACREAVLGVLGRLVAHNPASILPSLRLTMTSLIAELQYADAYPDVSATDGQKNSGAIVASGVTFERSSGLSGFAGMGTGAMGGTTNPFAITSSPAPSKFGAATGIRGRSSSVHGDNYASGIMGGSDWASAVVGYAQGSAAGPSMSGALYSSSSSSATSMTQLAYNDYRTHDIVLSAASEAGPLAGREHAARMLCLLVRASQRLVLPYLPLVLRALLPRAWGTAPGRLLGFTDASHPLPMNNSYIASMIRPEVLSTCVLACLGEISSVGAESLLPHLHVVMPLVVDGLTAAAHAMGIGPGPAAMGSTAAGASIEVMDSMDDLTGAATESDFSGGAGQGGWEGGTGAGGPRSKKLLVGARGTSGVHLVLGASGAVSAVPPVRLAPGTNLVLFCTVAIRTLGLLVENTGQVVVPYMDHPHLMGLLLTLLAKAPTSTSATLATASGGSSGGEDGGPVGSDGGRGGGMRGGDVAQSGQGGGGASGGQGDPSAGPASSGAIDEMDTSVSADRLVVNAAEGSVGSGLSSSGGGSGWNLRREVLRTLGIIGALDPYRYRMTLLAQAKRHTQAMQAIMQARLQAAVAAARATGRLLTTAGVSHQALTRGVRATDGNAMLLLGALGDRDTQDDMTVNIDGLPAAIAKIMQGGGAGGLVGGKQAGQQGTGQGVGVQAGNALGRGGEILLLPNGQGAWTAVGGGTDASAPGASGAGSGGGGGTPWELMSTLPPVIGLALGGGMAADPMEAALAGLAGEPGSSVGVNMDEVGMAVGLGVAGHGGMAAPGGMGFGGIGNNLDMMLGRNAGIGGAMAMDQLLGPGFGPLGFNAARLYGAAGTGGDGYPAVTGAVLGGRGQGQGGAQAAYGGVDEAGADIGPVGGEAGSPGGDRMGLGAFGALVGLPASSLLPSMVPSPEEFYPSVALVALLDILGDEALALHQPAALAAVTAVLKSLGPRSMSYLPRVMGSLLTVLRQTIAGLVTRTAAGSAMVAGAGAGSATGVGSAAGKDGGKGGRDGPISAGAGAGGEDALRMGAGDLEGSSSTLSGTSGMVRESLRNALRETVLTQIAALLLYVRQGMRPWLPTVFSVVRELWPVSLGALLQVIESTAAAFGDASKPYLATLIPHFLSVLAHDGTRPVQSTPAVAESYMRDSAYDAVLSASVLVADSLGLQGSGAMGSDGSTVGASRAAADGSAGSAPGPSIERVNTRYVLHTLAVLAAGGRRAMIGGHRRLLDDHYPVLIPAIARLIDAGVGVPGAPAAVAAALSSASNTGGSAVGAAGADLSSADGNTAFSSTMEAGPGGYSLPHFAASNSSSLNGYGAVLPIVRRQSIDTIAIMAASGIDLSPFASRLIQPLARSIADPSVVYSPAEVRRAALDCLALLLIQMKEAYVPWIPTVRRACLMGSIAVLGSDAHQGSASAGTGATASGAGTGGGRDSSAAGGASSGPGATGSGAGTAWGNGGLSGSGYGAPSALRHDTYDRLVLRLLGVGSGFGYGKAYPFDDAEGLGDAQNTLLYGYGPAPVLPTSPVDLAALLCDPGMCNADGTGSCLAAILNLVNAAPAGASLMLHRSTSGAGLDAMQYGGAGRRGTMGANAATVGAGVLDSSDLNAGALGVLGSDGANDVWGLGAGASKVATMATAMGIGNLYGAPRADEGRFGSMSALRGPMGSDPTGLVHPSEYNQPPKKLDINQEALKRAWDVSGRGSKEEWTAWLDRFALELLRESPIPALRACTPLAQVHPQLAKELFNAAFVAVWSELYDEYSDSLANAFDSVFNAKNAPQSVLRMLLAVVEFMERDDRAAQMPISPMQLGSLALRVGAFAKALHYREQEFVAASAAATGQTVAAAQAGGGGLLTASGSASRMAAQSSISKIVADLISVNNALDQPEAAVGILKHAMQLASGVAHYGHRAAHIAGGSARPGDAADNAMDGQALDQAVGGRMAGLPGGMDDGPLANARAAKQAALLAERSRSAVASIGQEGYVGTRDSVPDNLGSLPGTARRMASAGGASSLGGSVHGQGAAGQQPGGAGFSTGRGGGRGNAVLALGLDINEQWYEKLGRWDDALEAYERKQLEKPNSLDVVLGRMRCLKALGEWGRLEELARSAWPRLEGNTQGRALVAPLAARAAWALGRWGDMDVYLRYTDGGSLQGAFFRAVLATHALDFEGAARHIDRARRVLAAELSNIVSLGGEFDTYGRCYRRLVTVQQLAEIEESVTYLRLASAGNTAGASAYIAHVRNVWAVRMRGVARNVDVWHRLLSVRSLVTLAPDNLTEWLQFASLARRSGRQGMALRVLLGLGLGTDADAIKRAAAEANKPAYGILAGLGHVTASGSGAGVGAAPLLRPMPPAGHSSGIQETGPSSGMDSSASPSGLTPSISQDPVLEASARVGSDSGAHPRVIYSYLKHLWHAGHREQALMQLLKLTAALDASAAARRSAAAFHGVQNVADVKPGIFGRHYLDPADENALRVQCHLRCGQWHEALLEPVVAGYAPLPVAGAAGFLSGADQPGAGMSSAGAGPASSAASTSATLGQSGATTPGGGSTTPTPGAAAGLAPQGATTPAAVHISGRMPSDAYERLVSPVLASFRIATHECEERGHGHYRAWHAWAIANFTVAEYHAENLRAEEAAKASAKKEGKEVAGGTPAAGGHTGAGGKGKQDKAASGGGSSGNVTATPTKGPKPASYGLSNLAGVEEELEEEEDYEGPGLGAQQAAGTTSAVNALTAALGAAAGAGRVSGGPFPTKAAITAHAVAAVKAFFRSIALGRTRLKAYILQDLLRLLTLMFKYAESPPVRLAVEAGLSTGAISTDAWLQVVPQLIARLHIPNSSVKKLLTSLMSRIGTSHPQSLIYPLTVAVKSSFKPRRDAAAGILGVLKRVHAQVCDEADVVSRELIRVAILWHEAWHAGLEDASRAYFGEGNIAAMLAILLPLHEGMSRPGPETAREIAFTQAYGRDLDTAYKNLKAYQNSGRVTDLTAAWELYYAVFRRINKSLPSITVLDLASCSPKLLMAHDLALSVPGTYTVGSPVVRIASVCPQIAVIASKQRPRRITLAGSDGRRYSYLLKGHEDLRQDERVMQLFGLVNTLLTNDGDTAKRDLAIRRYAVTPLSHAAGVVGWVPGCDTLHALVRDYRDAKKVLLNIEHRLMVQMAPPYDHCTVLQKVETFRYALDNTLGVDLARVLWLKSASAEAWLSRRTAYVRSLAVMSMVGYVLGLGDRHPSNLMLDRTSGKILHIDFGDCFETAVTRDKFPERVPFRLTRMLVAAMEVAGVEGAFRSVAEAVMRVLRANRDSVMALLEAFVHDPLINWRLLTNAPQVTQTTTTTQAPPAAPAATVPEGKQGGHTSAGPGSSSDPGVEGPPTSAGTGGTVSGGGSGTALRQLPQPPPAASAGVSKLFEGAGLPADQASEVVKQGQRFHAEIEEGLLQTAVAEMGVPVQDKDANTSTALARSIAVTYGTVRGAVRGGDRAAISMAMAAGGAHAEGGGAEGAAGGGQGGQGQGQGGQPQHGPAQAGNAPAAADADSEALNERAVAVIRRIFAKLTGRDFGDGDRIGALMSLGIGLPPGSEATTGGGAGVGGIAGTAGMPGAGGLAALNLGLTFAGAGLAGGGVAGERGSGGGVPTGATAGGGAGATGSGLSGGMDVPSQVHRLILAAMSIENLAQAYVGWCPFW